MAKARFAEQVISSKATLSTSGSPLPPRSAGIATPHQPPSTSRACASRKPMGVDTTPSSEVAALAVARLVQR